MASTIYKKQLAAKIASLSSVWCKFFSTFQLIGMLCLLMTGILGLNACSVNQEVSQKTTLQLSVWGSQQELKTLRKQLNRFEAQYPNLEVELLHAPESYFQKLHLWVAAGLTPDVMMLNSLSYGLFAQHNVLADLSTQLSAEAKQDFFPQALQAFQWKSPQQERPIQAAMPRDVSNLVVYVNRDWLKRKKLAVPSETWTWDEALSLAKQLSEPESKPKKWALSFYRRPPLFWLPFVWSWGGQLINSEGTQLTLDEQKALAGLNFYQSLAHKYHVAPTRKETGGTPMTQLFLQQRVALLISGRWTTPFLNQYAAF